MIIAEENDRNEKDREREGEREGERFEYENDKRYI